MPKKKPGHEIDLGAARLHLGPYHDFFVQAGLCDATLGVVLDHGTGEERRRYICFYHALPDRSRYEFRGYSLTADDDGTYRPCAAFSNNVYPTGPNEVSEAWLDLRERVRVVWQATEEERRKTVQAKIARAQEGERAKASRFADQVEGLRPIACAVVYANIMALVAGIDAFIEEEFVGDGNEGTGMRSAAGRDGRDRGECRRDRRGTPNAHRRVSGDHPADE